MNRGAVAVLVAFVACPLAAGPLMDPAQCKVMRINMDRVESWSDQRKNDLFWQCMARTVDYRRAQRLSTEEALRLKEDFDAAPVPEMRGQGE